MAYKVIILYRLYMPSYVLGTFTEYPYLLVKNENILLIFLLILKLNSFFAENKNKL